MKPEEIKRNFIKHIELVDPGQDRQRFWRSYVYIINLKSVVVPFNLEKSQVINLGTPLSKLQLIFNEKDWQTLAIQFGLALPAEKLVKLTACPFCESPRRIMKNKDNNKYYWFCCKNIELAVPLWPMNRTFN